MSPNVSWLIKPTFRLQTFCINSGKKRSRTTVPGLWRFHLPFHAHLIALPDSWVALVTPRHPAPMKSTTLERSVDVCACTHPLYRDSLPFGAGVRALSTYPS